MHGLGLDLRFAVRQLRKSPWFTLIVVLTLALGVGATTAIFSLVEGILLRPLPFHDPDRLVLIGEHLGNSPNIPVTAREVGKYTDSTAAFSSVGAYAATSYELSGRTTPEEINGARLTASVFPTLGIEPVVGRVFTKQEEDAHHPVAVISYSTWINRYGKSTNLLGSSITLDRRPYTIIGVMPRGFEFPLQPGRINTVQLWVPMSLTADELSQERAGVWGYQLIARMKDGVTLAQAAQDVDRVAKQVMREFPPSMAALKLRGDARLVREDLIADVRPILRTLFMAAGVVLLIACGNVAGLLLVQAIRRQREFAIRLALGARAGAVIRESVIEGVVLGVVGACVGLAFASITMDTVLQLLPDSLPRISDVSMNPTLAMFAILLAVSTGALCGLAPVFVVLKTNLSESLKAGDRTNTGAAGHNWLRSALVVSEIGITLVLLIVSGAFLRSLQNMRAVDPGFGAENVLVAGYQLPLSQYATSASAEIFNREVVNRLSTKPGVAAVGIANTLPASGAAARSAYTVENEPVDTWKLKFSVFAITYGDYFKALQIPLREGRYFTEEDRADSPLVIIVNQSMAKHAWPEQSPIGKRMHVGNPHKGYPWATVVGVVADTKIGSRDEPTENQWYFPAQQPAILNGPAPSEKLVNPASGFIAVRAALPPEQMIATLRSAVAEVDPLLALQQVQPMTDVLSTVEAPRRFNTQLITAFALTALLLAVIGIYGVVAFSASMRNQEIAIRIALGAQRSAIASLVLGWGLRLAVIGCVLGVLGAIAASRIINAFLFGVSGTDPLIYLVSVIIMAFMTVAASALPAGRAALVDPVDSLRSN